MFRPFAYRSIFLVPFRAEGETASGIYVQHDRRLPPVYGRVTHVHSTCRDVRVGDWVVFLPNRPVRMEHRGGVTYALDERQILGVVEPGDGLPWFVPEPAEAVA